jgi:hypothetical protein
MAAIRPREHDAAMTKQILLVTFWALAGLYLGAIFARITGTSTLIGPLLAIVLGALVVCMSTWTTADRNRNITDRAEVSTSAPAPQATTTGR